MTYFLDELHDDLLTDEGERPRSQQVEIGGSGLFGCRAEHVLRLNGVPQSDPRLSWEAFVGSAIDHRIGEARLRRHPHLLVQHRVEYRGVWFTTDEYDKESRTLRDWKSKNDAAACTEAVAVMVENRPGHDAKRAQLHGGAAGLRAEGHEVDRVQLVFLPRSGGFDGARLFTEPFSQEWADKGVEWAAEVEAIADCVPADALTAINGYRDEHPTFCRTYCPYVTTCRGEGEPDSAEPDPALLDAAQRFIAARLEADEASARRDYYRGLLNGAPPIVTEGWKVAWSGGNPKTSTEVDVAALVEFYEFVNSGPAPTREVESFTARQLRVSQVRKPRAAK